MRVAILGGGISGLSAAKYLIDQAPGVEILLFEKQARLGGWLRTDVHEGFLFEKGPRTFSSGRSPHFLSLISDVGLDEALLFSDPKAAKRYIWTKGGLKTLSSQLWRRWWRLIAELWIAPSEKEESIYDFAKRRFGKELAENLFDPLTTGIFGGDARRLSVESCFPQFVEWEKKHGSLIRAAFFSRNQQGQISAPLFTLKRGVQQIVDVLSLLPIKIHLNSSVEKIAFEEGKWHLQTPRDRHAVDAVFCALPAKEVKRLFPCMPSISHGSLSVVNLGISQSFRHQGYGYLIPSREKEGLLGMIWDSQVFPAQGRSGQTRLTAMVRYSLNADEIAREALSKHLGIFNKPSISVVTEAKDSIPQFTLGHRKRIFSWEQAISSRFPFLYFLGNYFEGVSVEHCVARSKCLTTDWVNRYL